MKRRAAIDAERAIRRCGSCPKYGGTDPSEIDSARSTSLHAKDKDEKADASAPQEQGLVKGAPDELMNKPRWQRAIISFAGPLVNLVFPILCSPFTLWRSAFLIRLIRISRAGYGVAGKFSGAKAGLKPGDKIVALDGEKNPNWEQAEKVIAKVTPGSKLTVEVEQGGAQRSLTVPVEQKDLEQPERLLEKLVGFAPIRPGFGRCCAGISGATRDSKKAI